MMDVLPPELFAAIVKDVPSKTDLLTVRTLNSTFHDLVTPEIFRVVRVSSKVESMEAFRRLSECTALTRFVKEIIFQDTEWPHVKNDELEELTRKACREAFSRLHKFSFLVTLRLLFSPFLEEEDCFAIPSEPSNSTRLQLTILETVVFNPSALSIRSLALSNVVAFPNAIYDTDSFRALLAPLTSLSLSGLSDVNYEGPYLQAPLNDFWSQTVRVRFLQPPQSSITSLTLHSDQYVGQAPDMDFTNLHYPHLTYLSLRCILFMDCLQDFIIRHQSTLRKLVLDDCPMLVRVNVPKILWSEVWRRLEADLCQLSELVTRKRGPQKEHDGEPLQESGMGYVYLDDGCGYVVMDEAIPGDEEDYPSLKRLQSIVKERMVKVSSRT